MASGYCETPNLIPGRGIMGSDETLCPHVLPILTVTAGDDLTPGHHGSCSVLGTLLVIVFLDLPM